MTEKKIFAIYIGNGNFVQGVPSVDMTEAEWNAIPKDWQKTAITSGTHKLAQKGTVNNVSTHS